MTRTVNARVAGFAFLFYIAVGLTQSVIGRGVSAGSDVASRLASLSTHANQVKANSLLGLTTSFTALTLAVALYGLTREEDNDLAVLALCCRVGEGLLGALPTILSLALLSLTTYGGDGGAAQATQSAATVLFRLRAVTTLVGSLFFSVGSTLFAYLLLKGRLIPRGLAWLGVIASALLVVALPFQLVGMVTGGIAQAVWAPEAAFEIPLGIWLLVRGVKESRQRPADGSATRMSIEPVRDGGRVANE